MSILEMVTHGREAFPPIAMVEGPPGVGKSTFGAQWPGAVFIQTEPGLNRISCSKFPRSRSLDDVKRIVDALIIGEHPYKALIVDSVDWLEHLVVDAVCKREKVTSLDKVRGPYGTGAAMLLNEWRILGEQFVRLQEERGMAVLLIAHEQVKSVNTPEGDTYDQWVPKMSARSAAYINELCELIFRAYFDVTMKSVESKMGGTRNVAVQEAAGARRMMRCQPSPTSLTKTRFQNLPEQVEFTYAAIAPFLDAEIASALAERAALTASAPLAEVAQVAVSEVQADPAPVVEADSGERTAELERDNEWRRQQGFPEQLRTLAEEAEVMAEQEGESLGAEPALAIDEVYPPDQEGTPAAE